MCLRKEFQILQRSCEHLSTSLLLDRITAHSPTAYSNSSDTSKNTAGLVSNGTLQGWIKSSSTSLLSLYNNNNNNNKIHNHVKLSVSIKNKFYQKLTDYSLKLVLHFVFLSISNSLPALQFRYSNHSWK